MSTQIDQLFKISDSAVSELLRIIGEGKDTDKPFLRIGVKGGGCSGLTYVLEMDSEAEDDVVHDINGVPCLVKKSHALYLGGMLIDYKTGLDNRGFVFENPNATESCGCGTSFSL